MLELPRILADHVISINRGTRAIRLGMLICIVALGVFFRCIPRVSGGDRSFLIPVIAIASVSMLNGMLPGFFATGLFAILEWWVDRHAAILSLNKANVWQMVETGFLISVISGQVDHARKRARVSDAATFDLERKVLEISDEERRRIGHDLHDGLGQHLTGISLLSTSLANRVTRAMPEAAADAEQISQLISQSIGWTRDLARGLSPVTLESEGLYAALEELVDNARSLFRIDCQLDFDGVEPSIDKQQAMHIFRIVQEAVSNSVKHGKATNVQVHLIVTAETLTAKIADDGCGLSAKTKANPGLGLRIMNYRARMVGATLGIEKITIGPDRVTPASGTVVTLHCPLPVVAS